MDRVDQVNWIKDLAADLKSQDWDWDSNEDLVDYWIEQIEELPEWWDDHDKNTLLGFLED